MMLYEIQASTGEAMERCVNSFLHRWLRVPPSFTSIDLYSRTAKLQMPLSSIKEEFKVSKCRLVMPLRDSKDAKVSEAGCRQEQAGSGVLAKLYSKQKICWPFATLSATSVCDAKGLDRQSSGSEIQQEANISATWCKMIRRMEEGLRKTKAVELGQQRAWTRWNVPERKVTWSELWRMEPLRISFLLRSVYDVLSSPSNLLKWGLLETPNCQLCDARETLAHILSGCKLALQQERYRWRHD